MFSIFQNTFPSEISISLSEKIVNTEFIFIFYFYVFFRINLYYTAVSLIKQTKKEPYPAENTHKMDCAIL